MPDVDVLIDSAIEHWVRAIEDRNFKRAEQALVLAFALDAERGRLASA